MKKIFIDGSAGTTGLRLKERLQNIKEIELIEIEEKYKKDTQYKKEAMNSADAVVLCLPDTASKEAVNLLENEKTVLIDTSTAFRTDKDWVYGLPQLSKEHKKSIETSKKIAVCGCHACGFITLVQPLVKNNIVSKDKIFSCFSLTGYSGGGKAMINEYENQSDILNTAPKLYALSQEHKHLKEMKKMTNITNFPTFAPIVSNFYSGMEVMIPMNKSDLNNNFTIDDIKSLYKNHYTDNIINFVENPSENGFMSAIEFSGKDSMQITVQGNDERFMLIARYDNLGKGASGSALECLNLSLGLNHTNGLNL